MYINDIFVFIIFHNPDPIKYLYFEFVCSDKSFEKTKVTFTQVVYLS